MKAKRRGRPPGARNKTPAINTDPTPENLMLLSFVVDMTDAVAIIEFLKTKNIYTFQLKNFLD